MGGVEELTDIVPSIADAEVKIRRWCLDAVRAGKLGRNRVADLMGVAVSTLDGMIRSYGKVRPTEGRVAALARACRVSVPEDISALTAMSTKTVRQSWKQRLLAVDSTLLTISADTVEAEMSALIDLAAGIAGGDRAEDVCEMLKMRFGIGVKRMSTLQEIGARFGLTRERVRQREKMMSISLRAMSEEVKTPRLDALASAAADRAGFPIRVLEAQWAERLGTVPLKGALAFLGRIRSGGKVPTVRTAPVYKRGGFNHLPVLTTSKRDRTDATLVRRVSSGAYALQRYAGACSVADLGRLLSLHYHLHLEPWVLDRILEGLPAGGWLDESHRWFGFSDQPMSVPERKVALMIAVAARPLHIETIMGGLARATRPESTRKSGTFRYTDPHPPLDVLAPMLDKSRYFRRGYARTYSLATEFDTDSENGPVATRILEALRASGGILTFDQMRKLRDKNGRSINRITVAAFLHCHPCIERIAYSTYCIRGYPVSSQRRMHVLKRAPKRNVPRPSGPRFTMEITPTDYMRKNRVIDVPIRQVPLGAEGTYTLDSGDSFTLSVSGHSLRLLRMSAGLKSAIADLSVQRVKFDCDMETKKCSMESAKTAPT